MFPELGQHHFLFGRGMVSDDTEHACRVAEALLDARGNPEVFARRLARRLRWWLLGIPAGAGLATSRACLRLWMGIPPDRSGVFSAGNGPAMRSALLGVAYGGDPTLLGEMVGRSTRMTHVDPRAFAGALTVAIAAHVSGSAGRIAPRDFGERLRRQVGEAGAGDFQQRMDSACRSAERGEALGRFVESMGCGNGISGYMLHTVPCVIQVWLRHQADYRAGVEEVLAAGGDTDTTAAILGGITGAGVGKRGIPPEWLSRIFEWPRSTRWMESLGEAAARSLAGDATADTPPLCVAGIPFRNALFTTVVLAHGLRRLAPPY